MGKIPIPRDVLRNLGTKDVPVSITGGDLAGKILEHAEQNKLDYMSAFTAVTGVVPSQPDKVANYTFVGDEVFRAVEPE